ncbi:2,3,4,5-tetrahydropyridine-2,6-dicarboxylate N-succinyltransferase [BD1-7 clade bacterium]|uniref:2,3,4,5-tetrahydropyridine-2,6-dicarboxylate N-succinyltransferase n=1 Tax=BD1-7 clade bacterium TaxID=2029982 RepID=A0A5S9PVW7_9GAMM|nr:2,3,4,5-tetrahydropyridine-2,6-dicarboxylate N-succinyltransferase [BD1-7 clade bacterium]CAA0115553.1 2,3,4,5-tetrahydropyridine-2,6-dicarboxylate N-succinyltransferase [BD1-7 clade bacterium]CAA0119266.1 2,3,4,5-tetrahydropyridine-2,6-dicarboxylate N-succinyltransferase [BD1-7 clade bacterium]
MGIYAFGLGIGTQNKNGEWLEVFYPAPQLDLSEDAVEMIKATLWYEGENEALAATHEQMRVLAEGFAKLGDDALAEQATTLSKSKQPLVATILATDDAPSTAPEVYLKLHLLSHRIVKPHETRLDGMFGLLKNTAWTNEGAIDIDELPERQLQARVEGRLLEVMSVDKFPKMANYVVPAGVRVAHTARVRLGAYLGEGTTIMHEGFVNFNAGTEGTAMIEGRISAGVWVGDGSDLGGGCSTMGTLSGGNNVIISVGKECLVGANAGVGIPLGDRCTVEAGLYVTAGAVVHVLDSDGKVAEKVKARDLASKSDLLFRRNSVTGAIEALTNKSAIELNHELHAHN